MKRLRRLLLSLLVVALLAWVYLELPRFDLAWLESGREAWKLEYVPRATLSSTYVVDGEWLSFSLPSGTDQVKLIAAPNSRSPDQLRAARTADPVRRWRYAIDIEVTDRRGQVTLARTQHFRSDLGEIRDEQGRLITPTFHLSEALTPLVGSVVLINLGGLPDSGRLRLRLQAKDDELEEVGARIYIPEKKNERQIAYLWSRLSAVAKERLARGNVFSHELMLESERNNLLRNAWQPIGPLGTRGVDFRQRELYVLNDYQGEPVEDPALPPGTPFGGEMKATIALPENGGEVRIRLQPFPLPGVAGAVPVDLRWYGPGPLARRSERVWWRPDAPEIRQTFAGGLLELSAPAPFIARAFLGREPQEIDLNALPQLDRALLVNGENTVDYRVHHEGRATPLRLSLRMLSAHLRTCPAPAALRYRFLDGEGKTLAEGRLPVWSDPSPYDRLIGEAPGLWVSKPAIYYFSVPKTATLVRLLAADLPADSPAAPVLVSVDNRPATLPHQSAMPRDRYAFDPERKRLPVWFSLRPEAFERHLIEGRTRLVAVQARPPETRPELLSGAYSWEEILPRGRWLGRQLFSPREAGTPYREDVLPATYSPLPVGPAKSFDFPRFFGQRVLTPRLAWVAPAGKPWSAELRIDGEPPQHLRGAEGYGEQSLLPLPAGHHALQITADPAIRFFVNHTRASDPAYVARSAVALNQKTARQHSYETTLDGGEELTLRLFTPTGEQRPSRLRVDIDGPAPPAYEAREAWLLRQREIEFSPASRAGLPVFDTRGQTVDAGQPAFLPIPPGAGGPYRIRVALINGPGGYLLLSRLSTAPTTQRRWLNDPALEKVDESGQ